MPYYLVTQTSLMEGADEVEAAQKVLAKLKSDGAVGFTVKYDEENIRQVTVANVPASEVTQPAAREIRPSPEQIQEEIVPEGSAVNRADTGVFKAETTVNQECYSWTEPVRSRRSSGDGHHGSSRSHSWMSHRDLREDIGPELPFAGNMIAELLERADGSDRCTIPTRAN